MALDTYENLKAAIIRLDGSNKITSILDDAIDLCEAEIYANSTSALEIRSLESIATAPASTVNQYLALPTDYYRFRRIKLKLDNADADVLYATPESMKSYTAAGQPKFFTVTDQIEFDRTPDSAYTVEIIYLSKPTALSSSNATNVVLTSNPNIYLFGALWAVNLFNAEEDKATYYYGLFINAIRGANKLDKRGRYGPAPAMRTEGSTP